MSLIEYEIKNMTNQQLREVKDKIFNNWMNVTSSTHDNYDKIRDELKHRGQWNNQSD